MFMMLNIEELRVMKIAFDKVSFSEIRTIEVKTKMLERINEQLNNYNEEYPHGELPFGKNSENDEF